MKKQTIIIVGGASGIGLSTTEYLADSQYEVIVLDRSVQDEKIRDQLYHRQIDILDETSVREAFLKIGRDFQRIDGLVYTVGISSQKKSIEEFETGAWENVFNTNITGALLCLKYAFPYLKKSSGKVIMVGSVATRMATKLSGFEYTISKIALSGLVKQFAIDWAPFGILINSVHPSMTATPMLRNNVAPEIIQEIEQKIPLGRIAEPKEIAQVIEFLISRKNTYITGSGVDINGGLFLSA